MTGAFATLALSLLRSQCRRCTQLPEHVRAFRCPYCGEGPSFPTSSAASCRELACDGCGMEMELEDDTWLVLTGAEAGGAQASCRPFSRTTAAVCAAAMCTRHLGHRRLWHYHVLPAYMYYRLQARAASSLIHRPLLAM